MSNKLDVGGVCVPGRVWIAPMTGVSDLPFRETATALGAPYVATEMVASAEFAKGRPDVVRRAAVGDGLPLTVIQLVGRDIDFMAQGARMAAEAGAEIIDLNFGCPAKEVAAGAACGSALMREPDLAEALVAAAVEAVDVPVTVKMRLGWDDASRNAPEIAARAEAVGAKAITVHGRTRNQFYKGVADWSAVAEVKKAVSVPLLVNGDIVDGDSARAALEQSGADGVMVGRGVYGRPWIAGAIEAALDGRGFSEPEAEERLAIALTHFRRSLSFYGERLGLKMFRKHLASYIEAAPWPETPEARRAARATLCRLEDPAAVEAALRDLWLVGGRLAA
ncbi:tRNA dihydrouridine synthase DusB [Caulobacter sp. X]|uniref:tRNA dihydrouridine synthase DusB n=1 Tax=Caulobacter sp. X TaxID=2048901 RepID=UPI000C15DBC8|nr:tRNA dihydrouridine synthase DusB [Caulobacter sp. X]PIC00236.1 tRNA dihydrouridine synthase DusB [Caulobacter sp. X]